MSAADDVTLTLDEVLGVRAAADATRRVVDRSRGVFDLLFHSGDGEGDRW